MSSVKRDVLDPSCDGNDRPTPSRSVAREELLAAKSLECCADSRGVFARSLSSSAWKWISAFSSGIRDVSVGVEGPGVEDPGTRPYGG